MDMADATVQAQGSSTMDPTSSQSHLMSTSPQIQSPSSAQLVSAPMRASVSAVSSPHSAHSAIGKNAGIFGSETAEEILNRVYPINYKPALRAKLANFFNTSAYLEQRQEDSKVFDEFIVKLPNKNYQCTAYNCGAKEQRDQETGDSKGSEGPEELQRFDRMKDHFRTHINHRPYPCNGTGGCCEAECKWSFYTKEALRAHQTMDIPEKRVICEYCKTSIVQKNLKRHQTSPQKCNGSKSSSAN